MIKAYLLSTGKDGHSHVVSGSLKEKVKAEVDSLSFQETPAHSSLDWHTAPTTQYVITLSGVLEFAVKSGATFILKPGDVLIALDTTGTGHTWRLINDEPWRRAYVVFRGDLAVHFEPEVN